MTRFATWLLLAAGCSVELQGLSSRGAISNDGEDNTQRDDRSDGERGDGGADSVIPGSDASSSLPDASETHDEDDGGNPEPAQDAAMALMGFQPPIGQVGSRCSAAECNAPAGAYGSYCAMSGQVPIGSDTGYCTRSCTSSGMGSVGSACGQGSICVSVNGAGTCQRTCANDSDCRIEDGYYCASSFPLLLFVCWHH